LWQIAVITVVLQQQRGKRVSVSIVMEQLRGINIWVETAAKDFVDNTCHAAIYLNTQG
jgi:hypothetical protein